MLGAYEDIPCWQEDVATSPCESKPPPTMPTVVRDHRFISRVASSAPLVCNQLKMRTSGYTDVGGREEVGVVRLTPIVLRTAILHGTESSPDTEILRGGPRTVTEHASVVFVDRNPVRLVRKEPLSFAR